MRAAILGTSFCLPRLAMFLAATWNVLSLAVLPQQASAQPYNVANAYADLPGAALYWFKVHYLLPNNLRDFGEAVKDAYRELKPGETRTYEVVMTVAPEGAPIRFVRLIELGEPVLMPPNQCSVAKVEIALPNSVLAYPMPPMDRDTFDRVLSRRGIAYEDHVFSVQSLNAANGLSPSSPASASALRDLRDQNVRAGADGRVILVAQEGPKYRIFDIDEERESEYQKVGRLLNVGNTVYMLVQEQDREYTLVYQHLDKIAPSVKPGKKLTTGEILGSSTETPQPASYEVWKVQEPSQRWLQNGALRILPL